MAVDVPLTVVGVYRMPFDIRNMGQTLLRESDRLSNVFSIR